MMPRLLMLAALISLCFASVVRAVPPVTVATFAALQSVAPADTVVETLPLDNNAAIWLPEPFAPPVYHVDPRYKNRLTRAVYLYEKASVGDTMTRRVAVHFEPDDRAVAVRIARVAARLLRLHRERLGRDTRFPRGANEAHVWLVPSTPATLSVGGETRDADVYIFAPSRIVAPIELIRTVAHEWGHLTLPAARGYAAPENDAAGYLGERLYLYWMTFPVAGDRTQTYPGDAATLTALTEYAMRQSLPLMKRYADGGAMSPLLRGDSVEAMDYYIGMVLSCDEAFLVTAPTKTYSLIGAILWSVQGETAADFVRSAEREVAKATVQSMVIVTLPAYVPLAKGVYELESVSGGDDTITVSGATKQTVPLKRSSVGILSIIKSGWYRVSAGKTSTSALRLEREPVGMKPRKR
ncbi:MAG: hypothetical protein H7Y38_19755 [Armatimonadetes bacterium]|nr:hypothetical protein [Armatimonadota bacterium]